MSESFDVAIIGGGPAGAAAASILARLGRRVLLADAAPADVFRVGEGLPPSARSLLQELGVWEQFLADGHRVSYGNVSVWGGNQPQCTDFMLQARGHGYQLNRPRFDAMLKHAARAAGAQVCEQSRLRLLTEQSDSAATDEPVRLQLSNRTDGIRDITCRWLIHAGGRAAAQVGNHQVTRYKTDRLIAFHTVLYTNHSNDCDGRTMIEADENGWWYSVLLPSNERLVVYLCDHDITLTEKSALLSRQGFIARLNNTSYLGKLIESHAYRPLRAPQGADASSGRLERFCGEAWLAIGDAALSFDPLSSQGIANALYTGILGAKTVHAALDGKLEALAHYNSHLTQIYQSYIQNRAMFYGDERRWEDRQFWQRRHAA